MQTVPASSDAPPDPFTHRTDPDLLVHAVDGLVDLAESHPFGAAVAVELILGMVDHPERDRPVVREILDEIELLAISIRADGGPVAA